ncbi:MAG: transcription-repair coupling factor [Deltaproteobacteria bacterium]|nr:transcription-repair coupling factor [Deltaproteobacteria bacterium]
MSIALTDKPQTVSKAVEKGAAIAPGEVFSLSGLLGSSRAYYIARLFKRSGRPVLVVALDDEDAEVFFEDLVFFLGVRHVQKMPSTEMLPFELQPTHEEINSGRISALYNLAEHKRLVTVITERTLMQRVMPKAALVKGVITIVSGASVEVEGQTMDVFVDGLSAAGYARRSMVEERGEFSVRGGILDVFPPMYDCPLRVEFFGDSIESIRPFDVSTQRSAGELTDAVILPARESAIGGNSFKTARARAIERADSLGLPRAAWEGVVEKIKQGSGIDALLPLFHESTDTVCDYLRPDTIIVTRPFDGIAVALKGFADEIETEAEKYVSRKVFFAAPDALYAKGEDVLAGFKRFGAVCMEPFLTSGFHIRAEGNLDMRQDITRKKGEEFPFNPLASRLRDMVDTGWRVYLAAHNKAQAQRTEELLSAYGFSFKGTRVSGPDIIEKTGGYGFEAAVGHVSSGFRLNDELVAVISEEEVFGERVRRRAQRGGKLDAALTDLQDIASGDFVVHARHGIGIYRGLKRLCVDDIENDFMFLEYRDHDKLYLPVWGISMVSKFRGAGSGAPETDKLGGAQWEKKKAKVRHAVERLAGELLKLYAERQAVTGFAFSKSGHLFQEFEAGFDYEETPDQSRAIAETLKDMEDARPMDRLVCGDVGYGKTEVAMRAAFKAALDGKQSVVLVPTTILAQQHYGTFVNRFSPFPVTVAVLSRFKSRKEQMEIIAKLRRGEIDVLIGTHRLLQKDVEFKDLGLIVVDEEHRFGVGHKERLKMLKKKVDCLTLTATPIPRTLQMALTSVRELSVINTPPEDRLAIKTSVVRFDEAVIAEACHREMARGGQIFFVHNRVQSMGAMAQFLGRTLPLARIAVAHGQMNEAELEKKMLGFVNKDYDVLLSTAIIESGLDIPTANTIIINRADRFGLAELYQLRGRVGRSKHRSYAYLICPESAEMTGDAKKRINVLRELSEPGSGFKIASHDLEIRGAGELLGSAQSGNAAEVGFEMYAELLDEAVRELKGEEVNEDVEPEIRLNVSQYLPEDYIPETRQRLGFYKRLSMASSEEDLDSIKDELNDRYGELPAMAETLVKTMGLKVLLKRLKAKDLTQKGARLYITFGDLTAHGFGAAITARALALVKADPKRYRITSEGKFMVNIMEERKEDEKGEKSPVDEAALVLKEFSSARPAPLFSAK